MEFDMQANLKTLLKVTSPFYEKTISFVCFFTVTHKTHHPLLVSDSILFLISTFPKQKQPQEQQQPHISV